MKKKKLFIQATICSTIIALVFPIASTFAMLTREQLDALSENNIRYVIPSGNLDPCIGSSGNDINYDAEPAEGLSGQQVGFLKYWHSTAEVLSVAFGIPWETVVAQGILESASGTSVFARERNNFFGIGAFDSNPNNAFSYASPEAGWHGYYANIAKTSVYRNNGVFVEPTITDPYAYLAAIKAAGYATADHYIDSVGALITAIEAYSATAGWLSSAQLDTQYPEMIVNAASFASGDATIPEIPACGGFSNNQDVNAFLQKFTDAYPNGYPSPYMLGKNGCTTLTAWYINNFTNLKYGHGNGGQVARNLVSANSGLGLQISNEPRAPGIFSTFSYNSSAMCGASKCGHTGLVLAVNEDSVVLLETWSAMASKSNKATITTLSMAELRKYTFDFVFVGNHLK
jgi:hypothetical protein